MNKEGIEKIAKEIFTLAYNAVKEGKPADHIIAFEIRNRHFLGSNERHEVVHKVWNIFRNMAYLRFKLGDEAEADEIFDLSLKQVDLDGVPEYVKYNCPEFLFNEIPESELQAMQGKASFDIRVNISKMSRDKVIQMFKLQGITAEKTPYSEVGLRMQKHFNLEDTTPYKRGLVTVMDEGSQLVAGKIIPFINDGDKVLDLCAGAGGKTLALFDMLAAKGISSDFWATDIDKKRLMNLCQRAGQAAFKGIKVEVLNTDYEPFLTNHRKEFDVIIIDAPCSGTGTWRRAPDAKWRTTPMDLAFYEAEQQSILAKAKHLLKTSGKMFYITCSLRKEENEAQVQKFTNENKDFSVGFAEYILPSKYGTDGFFIALLENK